MHPLSHTFVVIALLLTSTVSKGDTFSPTVQFTLNPHSDQPQTVGSLAGSRVVKGDRLELSSTDGQEFSFYPIFPPDQIGESHAQGALRGRRRDFSRYQRVR